MSGRLWALTPRPPEVRARPAPVRFRRAQLVDPSFGAPAQWNLGGVSFTTPESVPAGMAFRVLEVQGHQPGSLADFEGDIAFVIDDELRHMIQGSGRVTGDSVRFLEKDRANGKDIRVWGIRKEEEAFFAEQTPSF